MIRGIARVPIFALIACLALGATALQAQTKTAKQAESLSKSADSAKKEVTTAVDQLGKLLQGYNSIIDGSAKNVQSAYKKLTGDLKSTQKTLEGVQKSVQSLGKEADKFFEGWEKDLNEYSNEDLKQKSMARLETSKQQYASLGKTLDEARDAFSPLLKNLNDQVLYLGRDLSPEAIADLKDEAQSLNQQAEEVKKQVQQLIASADAKPVETE